MSRPMLMSIAVGIGAAAVIALVGPMWGGLVVVLAVPLVFLTLSRTLFGGETRRIWKVMLLAAGVAWFAFLPVSPFARNSAATTPEAWTWLVAIGVVPLLAGLILTLSASWLGIPARDIHRR